MNSAYRSSNTSMPYIALSLDTSIFERYQCRLESGILAELSQFNDMPTRIVLSEVVLREVNACIKKRINSAKKSASDAFKDCENELLAAKDRIQQIKSNLNLDEDSSTIAKYRLKRFIKTVGIELVPVEGNVELKNILSSYFSGNPPFSETGKRTEFPDAFALMSLEAWADKKGGKVLVVSMDQDWAEYAENSKHLDCVSDLAAAFASFQPTNGATNYCTKLSQLMLYGQDDPIRDAVEQAVSDAANELSLWPEADGPFHAEGEYVELEIFEVGLVRNTQIIPLQAQESRLTVQARFLIESVATCDFEFAVYDSKDGDYVNMGDVQVNREFDFEVTALIEISGDFSEASAKIVVERVEIISAPVSMEFGYIQPHWMNGPDV